MTHQEPPPPQHQQQPDAQPISAQFCDFHRQWITQNQLDLQELIRVHDNNREDEQVIKSTVTQVVDHYLEYYKARSRLSQKNAPGVFSPSSSGSEFENSYLWLGGCRPTTYIRLVYVVSGLELEAQLPDLLSDDHKELDLAGLSAHQLGCVNDLQCRTSSFENGLNKKMAYLQESMADKPMINLLLPGGQRSARPAAVLSVLQMYAGALHRILEDADKLRMATLSRLLEILSPVQGLYMLIMASRLHIRVHEWGHIWDRLQLTTHTHM